YWMTMIATMVIIIILLLFALILIREHRFEFAGLTLALLVILYIPLIWINLAIGAKRLHDRDKSAWWLLLFYAAPGILSTAGSQMEDVGFIILHIISFSISVWAFVELGCLRGTPGANRYGPDPLGTSG
ncbi:MAG TPA: DUF805 domain-containing protein, partial [Xanthobacteraceae bacterium]